MTREEAIEKIKKIIEESVIFEDELEAFDMAIKALEQEPYEGDVIHRCENCKHYGEDLHGANCRFCQDMELWEVGGE